jgi:cysteinyl-tRNA synthetase
MAEMPGLKFYNTLTRSKEAFAPQDPANVRMYVCGPTVYDYAHIGNARPAIVFDVLFRLLRHTYGADHVTYVRNITDVDDKINARALRDYPDLPLNEAIRKVTEKTETQYKSDVAALGCLEPTHQPRATENIREMADIIQSLIDRGNAYVATGGEGREVLFSVPSMEDYGALSRRKLEDQQAGARVAVEAHKKNPGDFVLWKESAADQPGWNADFTVDGKSVTIYGRPGWHIECSAMSKRYLGETFDIHGGGLDLIFPHHENELAQSRCAHGTEVMANVWMHNGFLQVEGKKMSKSDGNFVTINELLDEGWDGRVLRFLMLKTHYRQPINWTRDGLQQAALELHKLARHVSGVVPEPANQNRDFIAALADDLNTPQAIAELHSIASTTTIRDYANGAVTPNDVAYQQLASALSFLGFEELQTFDANAMFARIHSQPNKVDPVLIESLMGKRLALIAAKNWSEADKIRDELLAKGIQLKDGKDPATGERITTWEVKR